MEAKNRPVVLLKIDNYEKLIDSIHRKCDQWLLGALSDARLLSIFGRVSGARWNIDDVFDFPDDVDWDSISPDILGRIDRLHERFRNTCRLMSAAKDAIEELNDADNTTAICRAYRFSKQLDSHRYSFG